MSNVEQSIYVAIDLKSFYASVECKERNLDPITTNLVVADSKRTEKTICLAVSPSLKKYGISGRARLFEVVQKVKEINIERIRRTKNKMFDGSSYNDMELKKNKNLKLDYIIAPPRMSYYMKYSTDIYNIYLKWFSEEDIYVYSIDEVFIDLTHYIKTYKMRAKDLATKVIQEVYEQTGITATAGIGTNLYLCKIAMDVVAKHVAPNKNGVRIAGLDELTYRKLLWSHRPITDFWRVGKGYASKLEKYGIYTMGDIARESIQNEELFYKLFGVNAELLIDHAWGWEPVTIKHIKEYKPTRSSISSGQVLSCACNYEQTELIIKEMAELLTLELVAKKMITDQIVLTIEYDTENLSNPYIKNIYEGETTNDRYGRKIPKHAHGTINLDHKTASTKLIMEATMTLYHRIINRNLLSRKVNIIANNITSELNKENQTEQINLFVDYKAEERKKENELKEKNLQKSILNIKNKYGKNAIIKAMNLQEGAKTIERNEQIGGHKG